MPALWSHDASPDDGDRFPVADAFMRGLDGTLDHALLPFDLRGTRAHVQALAGAEVLSAAEAAQLDASLAELAAAWERGEFTLAPEHEDGHTAIEEALTARLGELGKKVHTARSRNDQVLTALRLYALDRLYALRKNALGLSMLFSVRATQALADNLVMPGYTHGQPAMPLPVATWLEAFRDALRDDIRALDAAIDLTDQSPLGSAAGFGAPIPLDRGVSARAMEFSRVQENPVYCQQSRPKLEAFTLTACAQVAWTVGQFACDALLFASREYGFVRLPDRLTTGSSLMPQKRNPDVLELLRARHVQVEACAQEVRTLGARLGSGYHRDFQCTKAPFMRGMEQALEAVAVARIVVEHLAFDPAAMARAMTPELHATAKAHELVAQGVPFRNAYRQVKSTLLDQESTPE